MISKWLVMYYNGRGNREKIFDTKDEAEAFIMNCKGSSITLWKEERIND